MNSFLKGLSINQFKISRKEANFSKMAVFLFDVFPKKLNYELDFMNMHWIISVIFYYLNQNVSKCKKMTALLDIVYNVTCSRKLMSKLLLLGMTIRHITGSSKLINILNRFEHSASHSKLLNKMLGIKYW